MQKEREGEKEERIVQAEGTAASRTGLASQSDTVCPQSERPSLRPIGNASLRHWEPQKSEHRREKQEAVPWKRASTHTGMSGSEAIRVCTGLAGNRLVAASRWRQ